MESFQASRTSMFDNYSLSHQQQLSTESLSLSIKTFEDSNQDEIWQLRLPTPTFGEYDYAPVAQKQQSDFKLPSAQEATEIDYNPDHF